MEEYFINHNPKRTTPSEFTKHDWFEDAKKEAIRLTTVTGDEIFIYKLVGIIKPLANYKYEEAITRIPF